MIKTYRIEAVTEEENGKCQTRLFVEKDGKSKSVTFDPTDKDEAKRIQDELFDFVETQPAKEEKEQNHIAAVDERIEKLLNRAHNTISDIDNWQTDGSVTVQEGSDRLMQHTETAMKYAGKTYEGGMEDVCSSLALYGDHLTGVIDRLCWGLERTLDRYEKARQRLITWGDINYVSKQDEGAV